LERLELSEEARETQLALETERVRNAILSSVSHDLRTPLGSIMGAASTLVDTGDNLSEKARTGLEETIYEQSRRLDRLLENLLKMTRIEGQNLEVDAEWQIPAEIVRSAVAHLEPELDDRSIEVDLPPHDRIVWFDGPLIEQVLVNLLENALHYSPADEPISIDGECGDQSFRVAVADRGPGVDEDERDAIFEKFQQGRLGSEHGSGLGLTICRAVVEAHGGAITVRDRRSGPGAVFQFSLPQPETPPDSPPPVDEARELAATGTSDE
jgi:two-component system sensor histidine kinase KdpD